MVDDTRCIVLHFGKVRLFVRHAERLNDALFLRSYNFLEINFELKVTRRGYCVGNTEGISGLYPGNPPSLYPKCFSNDGF